MSGFGDIADGRPFWKYRSSRHWAGGIITNCINGDDCGRGRSDARPRQHTEGHIAYIAGRDIVLVETSVGRQAFYRSSGANSGSPGKWFPVDEFRPADGWFNKAAYTQKGAPLQRLGSKEFAEISEQLGKMSIPKGQQVPAGKNGVAEMTLSRILDFFGARNTPTTVVRPVPEK
jgi:hypothetical protein